MWNKDYWCKYLEKRFLHLGSGCFSAVYATVEEEKFLKEEYKHDYNWYKTLRALGCDRVIKVGTYCDATLMYLRWCLDNQGKHPWIPVVHSLKVFRTNENKMCESTDRELAYDTGCYIAELKLYDKNDRTESSHLQKDEVKSEYREEFGKFLKGIKVQSNGVIYYKKEQFPKSEGLEVRKDIHNGNIMWDPDINSLVITDPIAGSNLERTPPCPLFPKVAFHNVTETGTYVY